jgi:hypothetical protein
MRIFKAIKIIHIIEKGKTDSCIIKPDTLCSPKYEQVAISGR